MGQISVVNQSNQILHCAPKKDGSLKCWPSGESVKEKTFTDHVKDTVNIDRGLFPAGQGLMAGGAAGLLTGAGTAAFLSAQHMGVYELYTVGSAAKLGGIVGGGIGAVTGAVAANFVDSKLINATLGAIAGGVASGAIGGGWLIGGLAGAAGALAGTAVIEKQ